MLMTKYTLVHLKLLIPLLFLTILGLQLRGQTSTSSCEYGIEITRPAQNEKINLIPGQVLSVESFVLRDGVMQVAAPGRPKCGRGKAMSIFDVDNNVALQNPDAFINPNNATDFTIGSSGQVQISLNQSLPIGNYIVTLLVEKCISPDDCGVAVVPANINIINESSCTLNGQPITDEICDNIDLDGDGSPDPLIRVCETVEFRLCIIDPATVPTLSQWGIFLFALFMITVAVIFMYNKMYRTQRGVA